jgi:hypothetical protein
VRVRATWRGVDVTRRLVRLGPQGPFVVADALQAAEPHLYTWQLNGHGGGEVSASTFELLADGARWTRPKASLRAVVLPVEGTASVGHRLEEHAPSWGTWQLHEALTVDASMAAQAGFLALLLATPAGVAEGDVVALAAPAGVAALRVEGGVGERVIVQNRGAQAAALPLGGATLEAPVGLSVWTVGSGGTPVLDCAPDTSVD